MQVNTTVGAGTDSAEKRRVALLQDLLERMQVASSGGSDFDAAIIDVLGGLPDASLETAVQGRLSPGPQCSTVLMDAVGLLPADYNFSLGRRDGVCWAWIQPNDGWKPAGNEARHDHPGGSGLAVNDTPVLAVACAAIRLHIRLLEDRQRSALHRLMYVSRSRLGDPKSELTSIVSAARYNNARNGITGVLLQFEDGVFCQVLEGPLTQVDSRFSRISDDPRHTELRVLQSVPARKRRYPGWPMGLARNCRDRPRFEDLPSSTAADVMLGLILKLEYQQEYWAPTD